MTSLVHKRLNVFISFLTVFSFLVWIVPLGAFIASSAEKKICGGQRAICLCTSHLKKTHSSPEKTTIFQSTQSSQNNEGSGPQKDFFLALKVILPEYSSCVLEPFSPRHFRKISLQVPEPVPKV